MEHSAILSTCSKLSFVFQTFVLSIFSGRLKQVLLYALAIRAWMRETLTASSQSDQYLCCSFSGKYSIQAFHMNTQEVFLLLYVAEQSGLCLTWSETTKTAFSRVMAHIFIVEKSK